MSYKNSSVTPEDAYQSATYQYSESYSLINQSHRQTPKEYSKKSGIQEKRKTALMPLKKIMFSGFKVDFGI